MSRLALLISPLVKSAYFHEYLDVAKEELRFCLNVSEVNYSKISNLEFLIIENNYTADELLELSFVQGVFEYDGSSFKPIDEQITYNLHEDFVFAAKFKGKTNETLTQLLINLGLNAIEEKRDKVKILDPMCGRGTTLLWGLRYNLLVKGIEQDPKALNDIRANLKKWTKLHKVKHSLNEGFVDKSKKNKFLEFCVNEKSLKVVNGDARNAVTLLKGEKFNLLISDLPYGVQHFTTQGTRNPLNVLKECIAGWKELLKKDGAIILSYNANIPKRNEMISLFSEHNFECLDFNGKHRMSESILRDIIILKQTQ